VQTTWIYDPIYQMLNQQRSGQWATYTYDSVGNIQKKALQGQAIVSFLSDNNDAISTYTNGTTLTTATYDAAGNLIAENAGGSITSYYYDPENRLVSVLFADGTRSTYTYNGDGLRRTAFEAGDVLTTFIWDGTDYLGQY